MAGAGEVVVLDQAKSELEHTQAAQIRSKMLQDTVGNVGKNIMDIVSQYEDVRDKENKRKLTSLGMAGALVGGMDNLPTESKDKLPGLLGVEMPRDKDGHVIVTPDFATVMHRAVESSVKDDPSLALVATGLQQPKPDPSVAATEMRKAELNAAKDLEVERSRRAGDALNNATKVQVANIEADATRDKANQPKPQDQASQFVMDDKTNTLMTEPQWVTTYPGKAVPSRLTYRQVDAWNKAISTQALNEQRRSATAVNNVRIEKLHNDINLAIKNPKSPYHDRVQLLGQMANDAMKTGGNDAVKQYVNSELTKIVNEMGGYDTGDLGFFSQMASDGLGLFHSFTNWFSSAQGSTNIDAPHVGPIGPDSTGGVELAPNSPGGAFMKGSSGAPSNTNVKSVDDWLK